MYKRPNRELATNDACTTLSLTTAFYVLLLLFVVVVWHVLLFNKSRSQSGHIKLINIEQSKKSSYKKQKKEEMDNTFCPVLRELRKRKGSYNDGLTIKVESAVFVHQQR